MMNADSSNKSRDSGDLVMRIGMLWYEKDADNVYKMMSAAAAHYTAKFGTVPERCHVHPVMFKENEKIIKRAGNMEIVLDKSIRPNHVWIGVVR